MKFATLFSLKSFLLMSSTSKIAECTLNAESHSKKMLYALKKSPAKFLGVTRLFVFHLRATFNVRDFFLKHSFMRNFLQSERFDWGLNDRFETNLEFIGNAFPLMSINFYHSCLTGS